MNWKDTIRSVAPVLGTLLGGPLAGTAVKVLGETLLGKPDATEAEVEGLVASGLAPEQLMALKQADVRLKEIGLEEFKAAAADTAHAREAHKGDRGVYWLGIAVLATFAAVMTASLYGSYQILIGGLHITDPGVIAAVFGFLGTVVGYVAANAQQVVAYFFGSSRGSKEKTDAMAHAFQRLGRS